MAVKSRLYRFMANDLLKFKMPKNIVFIIFNCILCEGYRNHLFTIAKWDDSRDKEYKCLLYEGETKAYESDNKSTNSPMTTIENPFEVFQNYFHKFLHGDNIETDDDRSDGAKILYEEKNNENELRNYVMGNFMRAELFNNKSGVHLPPAEFIHHGYAELKITRDFMQTAVNAFAIFLYGTLTDIERLPADYVLLSARSISMMKIAQEKLSATWNVVRGSRPTIEISYQTLELYRPLFKYINGREMARLNLSDDRILSYIGTHADLDRHQVGVIASKYIKLNKDWSEPKYLNLMNNLLCGVPMIFMRKLPSSTYLQLSHQVFYHIRACDPLQRRFFLAMMTRTQALGKSYSWNAGDVSRLGLLLSEVDAMDLSAINPQAMAGITAQVMLVMPAESLQYLTEAQLQYIGQKPLNILGRKLKAYQDQLQLNDGIHVMPGLIYVVIIIVTITRVFYRQCTTLY